MGGVTGNTLIPIVRGRSFDQHLPEYREMMKYESGSADQDAAKVPGPHSEPWLNVVSAYEPASQPALEHALINPVTRAALRGKVIDLASGTCWATARLSQISAVEEVVALDTSERFLTTVGNRVITALSGDKRKIRFAISSFNDVPFEPGYFDCAVMIAAIHHSVTPLRTLGEILRLLKPNGSLVIIEQPFALISIQKGRAIQYQRTVEFGATELAYTRGELEYLLQHAGFADVTCHAVDALTKNRLKLVVRKLLRAVDLERVFLGVTYVIHAKKPAS
jgi:ubiquinone/menaquinone biosynthesis C-methylase UbiE